MFELVPLIHLQRELLELPRGRERFRRYLQLVTGGTGDAVRPPLVAFNPMSKGHVVEAVSALLAMDAEAVAAVALAEADSRLAGLDAAYRVGLVVADDVAGGWTDRQLGEAHGMVNVPTPAIRRRWITVPLWAGDPVNAASVRRATLASVFRQIALERLGAPRTLRQVLDREARVARFSGADGPSRDPDDLAYTREVLGPHLDSDDFPVLFAALYGDEAARRRGYAPLGLSPMAGLAVARDDAGRLAGPPEAGVLG